MADIPLLRLTKKKSAAVFVNERDHRLKVRSTSAISKYAGALRKISSA